VIVDTAEARMCATAEKVAYGGHRSTPRGTLTPSPLHDLLNENLMRPRRRCRRRRRAHRFIFAGSTLLQIRGDPAKGHRRFVKNAPSC
jgi:hypothetical protein